MSYTNRSSGLPESLRLSTDASREDIAELLAQLPLFEDMDSKEMDILSRHFKLYTAQAGTVLFHEGDRGDFMAIVVDGTAEVLKSHDETPGRTKVATAGFGKLVGEMALIDGQPRSASATFREKGRVLVLTKESFESIVAEYERVGISLLWRLCRNLSQRLRLATGMLSAMSHHG